MLWSSVSIPRRPTILVIDASRNVRGWEYEFSDLLFARLSRRGLSLTGDAPVRVEQPSDMAPHLEAHDDFNCVLLLGHGDGDSLVSGARLGDYWDWLNSGVELPPVLFCACMWESYDPQVSKGILESPESFAPLAISPQSPLTPRESGLFLLKFFTELNLHSTDSITGKMVWFSGSKAKELLRRRRLPGKVGVRC